MEENTLNTSEIEEDTSTTLKIEESILPSVKKMLGITEDYKFFDSDLIMHINSVFMILHQLGVGPSNGFSIADDTVVWSDYLSEGSNLALVKSYMGLKVKLLFDPPSSSATIESINRQISEFEWRLNVEAETKEEEE